MSGFDGTPFHAATSAATGTPFWYAWDRSQVVDVYTDVNEEVRGFRRTAAIADMSPLNKTLVTGRDSARLVDRIAVRDISRLRVGGMIYTPWCNRWGKVVGDGLVLRTYPDSFVFSAGPVDRWLALHAGDLEVEIRDVTRDWGILALQGPQSRQVLSRATGGTDWFDLAFSHFRRSSIAGATVDVLRTGFTGELGYEIWVGADEAVAVWEAVVAAGAHLGLALAGEYAVDVARVEAGLILIGADYNPAGLDRRVAHYDLLAGRESSPYELGLGRLIDLGKGPFVGREALEREARSGGPPLRLVGLEIEWRQVLEARLAAGLDPNVAPRVRKDALAVTAASRPVGLATSVTWSPTGSRLIGFGRIERGLHRTGTRVEIEWPVVDEVAEVSATVVDLPFVEHRRTG